MDLLQLIETKTIILPFPEAHKWSQESLHKCQIAKKLIFNVFKISSSSPSLYKKGTFDKTPEQFINESNPPNSSTVFFIQFSAVIFFKAS